VSEKSLRELFLHLLKLMERVEERLAMMEANSTLLHNAIARHGRSIEDLNRRCIERLGKICPMNGLDNRSQENGGKTVGAPLVEAIGDVDGVNRDFNTSTPYAPGSLQIFRNGRLVTRDLDDGYEEVDPVNMTFRMKVAPKGGDVLFAFWVE